MSNRTEMFSKHTALVAASLAIAVVPSSAHADDYYGVDDLAADAWDAITKPKKSKTYKHDYCKTEDPFCGVIAYANAGGYIVKSVDVHAKDSQPSGVQLNPYCTSVAKKFTSNLELNEYDVFIVPANCLYKLKINIQSGPKKDRIIMLTPGCVAQTWTDGTTGSNKWHKDIHWSDEAKKKGASGPVQDPAGNKCSVS